MKWRYNLGVTFRATQLALLVCEIYFNELVSSKKKKARSRKLRERAGKYKPNLRLQGLEEFN
ncbi:MAG: hypothetical protein SGI98_09135 [Verrucomicrobiota bacterium]|nr:hypothetical protein [Verrucomicrobiota bacterium]